MRYTHSWACHPTEPAYARAWAQILADTATILDELAFLGIALAGPNGSGTPILDYHVGIAVNGDAAAGQAREPLALPAPHRNPYPLPCGVRAASTGGCDTGRHPYDLAVTAILLRCHLLLGDDFAIRSEGGWDTDWAGGIHPDLPGPRPLLTDLFGAIPDTSPLPWPVPRLV
jgi:hypothetical protein